MLKEQILDVIESSRVAYKRTRDLISFLAVKTKEDEKKVSKKFYELLNSGEIVELKKGKFISSRKPPFAKGVIVGNARGFAFCKVKGRANDFFIPERGVNFSLDGDEVVIKILSDNEKSQDAVVIKVVNRANTFMVGQIFDTKSGRYFAPDNNKIGVKVKISKDKEHGACVDDKVRVKVDFDFTKRFIEGEVVEILGKIDDVKTLELAIIREHRLFETFPEEVMKETEKISDSVKKEELNGRVDLTKETIFTIDGFDAKDFDDAVCIQRTANGGYKLGVHIADVTHYVTQDSPIDQEAFLRGTSVYFPSSVLPMLPEKLSNGVCSLNENVIRLTLSVDIEYDKDANVISHKIYQSYIKSKKRLTYTEVYDCICGKEVSKEVESLKEYFVIMAELSKKLEETRTKNGALDLDLAEAQFTFDENGYVNGVEKRERNAAHKLIESFMIAANEVVAKEFTEKKIPFVYRVHEKPNLEKIKDVIAFITGLGLAVPEIEKGVDNFFVQSLLDLVKDKAYRESANRIILRAMQKAKYTNECLGHFGLALEFYCHFTSPIRRYPDLCIHRIIKETLTKKMSLARQKELKEFTFEASENSSSTERNADVAERDVDDLWKAYLMKDQIGKEFEGIIDSITSFGMFVELENTCEGLVKMEDMPKEGYLFLEKSLKLKGPNRIYSIGDKVKVTVVGVNLFTRKIDFRLLN